MITSPSTSAPPVTSSAPTTTATPKARIEAINIFRGLAILEVVLHHTTGMALRQLDPASTLHFVLAIVNRTLHFAVPGFLFMTAVVLTRSVLREFEPKAYYWGRVKKSLMPYLVWTVLYVLFRVATSQDPPSALIDPSRWQTWVQYGKGYFHLYFLVVALQFYLVLPLLLPLLKRKWNVLLVAGVAFGAQLIVYWLNRSTDLLDFRFPATMVLWYIPAITLGMYFGANYATFDAFWRRYRVPLFGLAVLGFAWYLPQSYAALVGERVDTFSYSAAHWVFTTTFAVALFGFAHSVARGPEWFRRPLAVLGGVSLQIYLLHPGLLFFANHLDFSGDPLTFGVTVLLVFLVALLVPFALAKALEGTKLGEWLFGR